MSNTLSQVKNQADSIHHRIEEWLNSATHGLGALLSVIGTVASFKLSAKM